MFCIIIKRSLEWIILPILFSIILTIKLFLNQAFSYLSSATKPFAFKRSLIFSSVTVMPRIFSYISNPIETNSIFLGEGLVVSIVFTNVFKANP